MTAPKQVKVVSDGTPYGTRVLVDGADIELLVTKVTWSASIAGATATIVTARPLAEFTITSDESVRAELVAALARIAELEAALAAVKSAIACRITQLRAEMTRLYAALKEQEAAFDEQLALEGATS